MTTTIRSLCLTFAALATVTTSSSGCSLLVRAVKGEVTPLGADGASSSDVSSLGRTLASSDDPAALNKAFADLTSIYLYKCLNSPPRVPKEGKSEIRSTAGETLVAGLQARLARHAPGDDAGADALSDKAASLTKEATTKCDADKFGKQDAPGHLAAATALTTVQGRQEVANGFATQLESHLETALGEDNDAYAVQRWASQTCPQLLSKDAYCIPHALQVLHEKGRWGTIANGFLSKDGAALGVLATEYGADTVVGEVQTFLLETGDTRIQRSRTVMNAMTSFLKERDAWGGCKSHSNAYKALIKGDDSVDAEWALDQTVQDKCTALGTTVIKALGSDSSRIRAKAAWAVGELDLRAGKKHVYRLRWNDPEWDVRDAAAEAYNKLELQAS